MSSLSANPEWLDPPSALISPLCRLTHYFLWKEYFHCSFWKLQKTLIMIKKNAPFYKLLSWFHHNSCLQIDAYNAVYSQHTRDLIKSACFLGSMNVYKGSLGEAFSSPTVPMWAAVRGCPALRGVSSSLSARRSGHAPKGDGKSVRRQAAHCKATLGGDSGFRPFADRSLTAPLFLTGHPEINVMVHCSLCASWVETTKTLPPPPPRKCPAAILASLLRNRNQCCPVRQR